MRAQPLAPVVIGVVASIAALVAAEERVRRLGEVRVDVRRAIGVGERVLRVARVGGLVTVVERAEARLLVGRHAVRLERVREFVHADAVVRGVGRDDAADADQVLLGDADRERAVGRLRAAGAANGRPVAAVERVLPAQRGELRDVGHLRTRRDDDDRRARGRELLLRVDIAADLLLDELAAAIDRRGVGAGRRDDRDTGEHAPLLGGEDGLGRAVGTLGRGRRVIRRARVHRRNRPVARVARGRCGRRRDLGRVDERGVGLGCCAALLDVECHCATECNEESRRFGEK